MFDLRMALAIEAEKLKPLAATVRKLTEQLAHLRHRFETERGNVGKREADLESLKAAASSYLAENTFPTFKVRLKKITETLAAAQESVVLFETDLIPRTEKGLAAATLALQKAVNGVYTAAVPACEVSLAKLLDAVVAELDGFAAAFEQLREDYGIPFSNREPPHAAHARISGTDRCGMGGLPWITFLPPPAAAATAPAAPAAAVPEAISAAPTRTCEESVASEAPRAETIAPVHKQDGPGPLGAAAARARVLLRPNVAPGETGDVPPTPVEPLQEVAPAALAPDTLALDADEDEAPPDLDEAAAAEADAG